MATVYFEELIKKDYLYEAVKTVRNLCNVAEILIETNHRELLPTVLELMHQETQEIALEYCVKSEE